MAFSDYHACDRCGERKTFYDADLDPEWIDGHWRYQYSPGGTGYGPFMGYRIYSLCHECEKTYEIVIVPKGSSTSKGQEE
jgi:hypothetical protein